MYCLIHCLVISIANLVAKLATVRHAVVIGIDLEASVAEKRGQISEVGDGIGMHVDSMLSNVLSADIGSIE